MVQGALLLLLLASGAASADAPARQAKPLVGPSFSCTRRLTATEKLICGDGELSAYDRAMAFAYGQKTPPNSSLRSQKEWLGQRNKCGADRRCVINAYRAWLDDLEFAGCGPEFNRIGDPPADGSDLLLGGLESPIGKVKPIESDGRLFIKPLGGSWYLFSATAELFYDPSDGRGPNAATAAAAGIVQLQGEKGIYTRDPSSPDSCTITFRIFKVTQWELSSNSKCGGIGTSLSGIYRR